MNFWNVQEFVMSIYKLLDLLELHN